MLHVAAHCQYFLYQMFVFAKAAIGFLKKIFTKFADYLLVIYLFFICKLFVVGMASSLRNVVRHAL